MAEIIKQQDGIIEFSVLINGQKIKDEVEVQEIEIDMELNKIANANLVIQDGGAIGAVNEAFVHSEGKDFIPGSEIEIALGYKDKTETVFKGLIVSQQLRVKSGRSQLSVQCFDKAIAMTKGRNNAIFEKKKDSDLIKGIIGNHGLANDLDATTIEHPVIMQSNCSDWDFVLVRAEANNMFVRTNQNKLEMKKLDFSKSPAFELKASQIVVDIDLKLLGEDLATNREMNAWDIENQELVTASVKGSDKDLNQGNLSYSKLSGTVSKAISQYTSASVSKQEMELWLEAQNNRSVLGKIEGKITLPGTTKIVAGDLVKLSEYSARFNGKAFVTKVNHKLQDGEWLTDLHVGSHAPLHASLQDITEPGASGLLPPFTGVHLATVLKIHEDPDNQYRVQLNLPSFTGEGQDKGLWARLSMPYASGEAGFFFFPEIGDEVIVAFVNDDPRFPIVLGSLYSSKNKPKEMPDEKNQFKSIYSKSGINIRFDDEDKILTIETPAKNVVVLDDKNKLVSITDMNDNKLTMDGSGITLKSPKDINLEADGNIGIKATSNVEIKATADAKMDGANITQSAQASFTAKGNASAELSASGQTTVKGAMVMIN